MLHLTTKSNKLISISNNAFSNTVWFGILVTAIGLGIGLAIVYTRP